MKTRTDFITGGTLIIRGEHVYLIVHNSEKKYKLHIPKSLFNWLLENKKEDNDEIISRQELLDREKEEREKKLSDGFFS